MEDSIERLREENASLRQQLSSVQALKEKNSKLFNRLAAEKSATKTAQEELKKRDAQICILTEHIEKLMNALKQEGQLKREAKLQATEFQNKLEETNEKLNFFKAANKEAKKHAHVLGKQDNLLTKQLQVMDSKFTNLYRAYQQTKSISARKEQIHSMQIEQISDWVWTTNNKISDMVTARTNTLLAALKMFESIYGQMSCTVMDFQECMLGDVGVKALGKTIQAIVARQNQRKEIMQQAHAKRFEAWNRNGGHGPIPTLSASDRMPLAKSCLLNLAYNGITDKGVKSLAVALAKCKNITEIDLRGNQISRKSIPVLADMLMYNGNIEAIDLSGNYCKKEDLIGYIERLKAKEAEMSAEKPSGADPQSSTDFQDEEDDDDDLLESLQQQQQGDYLECEGDHPARVLPVLTSSDKSNYSLFRYATRPRPKSAPPRPYTTKTERKPEAFLPKHAYHSQHESSNQTRNIRQSDILKRIAVARLYPPQKSPYSALSRITLDSISSKQAQNPDRRVRPRPESAMISREGGQELPKVTSAMTQEVTGRPTTAIPGVSKTSGGKVKFTSSKIKQRLQISSNIPLQRPHTAGASPKNSTLPSPVKGSPSANKISGSKQLQRIGSPSASRFSPTYKSPTTKNSKRTSASMQDGSSETEETSEQSNAGNNNGDHDNEFGSPDLMFEYAPISMQSVFSFARKGNVGGILNFMKKIEPNALLVKAPPSFHPDMRQNETGETVIMHAARTGQRQVIELMLEKGADVNAVSNEGWTALHHAVDANQCEVIDLLIQFGAQINAGEGRGLGTPLHLALRLVNVEAACKLLARKGINIDARDAKGRTPLHLACLVGRVHLINLLRQHGASAEAKDARGRTPLDYALQRKDLAAEEALRQNIVL